MPSLDHNWVCPATLRVATEDEGEEGEESESGEEEFSEEDATEFHDSHLPMKVLPLYSLLSPAEQCKVLHATVAV